MALRFAYSLFRVFFFFTRVQRIGSGNVDVVGILDPVVTAVTVGTTKKQPYRSLTTIILYYLCSIVLFPLQGLKSRDHLYAETIAITFVLIFQVIQWLNIFCDGCSPYGTECAAQARTLQNRGGARC